MSESPDCPCQLGTSHAGGQHPVLLASSAPRLPLLCSQGPREGPLPGAGPAGSAQLLLRGDGLLGLLRGEGGQQGGAAAAVRAVAGRRDAELPGAALLPDRRCPPPRWTLDAGRVGFPGGGPSSPGKRARGSKGLHRPPAAVAQTPGGKWLCRWRAWGCRQGEGLQRAWSGQGPDAGKGLAELKMRELVWGCNRGS